MTQKNEIRFCPLRDLDMLFREDMQRAFSKLLDRGHYVLGEEVNAFEQEAALYLGSRGAIGVASGTDALFLSLIAVGIQARG